MGEASKTYDRINIMCLKGTTFLKLKKREEMDSKRGIICLRLLGHLGSPQYKRDKIPQFRFPPSRVARRVRGLTFPRRNGSGAIDAKSVGFTVPIDDDR